MTVAAEGCWPFFLPVAMTSREDPGDAWSPGRSCKPRARWYLPGGLAVVPADLGEGAELLVAGGYAGLVARQGRIGCCLRG